MARTAMKAISARRVPPASSQPESELVVAILRTAMIILAVLAPVTGGGTTAPRLTMQISVVIASIYNVIIILLYWRRIRFPGQRQLMVLGDLLLVTVWVYLTWEIGPGSVGSPLFPLYYIVILIGAMWFGVAGALTAAGISAALYLLTSFQTSGGDPFVLIDALFRQIAFLFITAITAGYLVDTYSRERDQWARSQILLTQYQERFRAAQEVYELLIPVHAPRIAGVDLAARWRPALREGGGDFYDVVTPTPDRVVLTIADVSGKHARGALKLPLFKAAFLATTQVWEDPGDVLHHVNRIVYPLLQPDMFISACVVVVDFANHRLRYANAGQDPPIVIQGRTRDIVELTSGGLILGVDETATYPTEEIILDEGDTLCLYTDGITEARNPEGDEFGFETLQARVQAAVALGLPSEGIADNIFDAVAEHVRGEARHDDMTVLVMRYRPTERDKTME